MCEKKQSCILIRYSATYLTKLLYPHFSSYFCKKKSIQNLNTIKLLQYKIPMKKKFLYTKHTQLYKKNLSPQKAFYNTIFPYDNSIEVMIPSSLNVKIKRDQISMSN